MCGKCAAVCPQSALEIFGTEMSTYEICTALLKDKDFYNESNGGITLSGGECLLQSEACFEILKIMKQNGINTAVDTCGFVPRSAIDKVMPYTDTFLLLELPPLLSVTIPTRRDFFWGLGYYLAQNRLKKC